MKPTNPYLETDFNVNTFVNYVNNNFFMTLRSLRFNLINNGYFTADELDKKIMHDKYIEVCNYLKQKYELTETSNNFMAILLNKQQQELRKRLANYKRNANIIENEGGSNVDVVDDDTIIINGITYEFGKDICTFTFKDDDNNDIESNIFFIENGIIKHKQPTSSDYKKFIIKNGKVINQTDNSDLINLDNNNFIIENGIITKGELSEITVNNIKYNFIIKNNIIYLDSNRYFNLNNNKFFKEIKDNIKAEYRKVIKENILNKIKKIEVPLIITLAYASKVQEHHWHDINEDFSPRAFLDGWVIPVPTNEPVNWNNINPENIMNYIIVVGCTEMIYESSVWSPETIGYIQAFTEIEK